MTLKDSASYEEQILEGCDFSGQQIRSTRFELCRFIACDFSEAELVGCKFTECAFLDSNLNIVKLDGTRFIDTEFRNCRVTGVNWTSLDWNSVALSAPFFFDACDISYCVFAGLHLPELQMTHSKAHDVDFSECDLVDSNFFGTDFMNARFNRTRLDRANFTDASNYAIDPMANSVEGASFSIPEVLSLLSTFKIRVDN